jgi:hypothetical protein
MKKGIIFSPKEEERGLNPWDVTCEECGTKRSFSMSNGGKNDVLIIDRIGVRMSDMYTCDECGTELYHVAAYMDSADGWSLYESHKIHYPKDIRYMDLDQQDMVHRLVNMSNTLQPTQRLSTISLMLTGVWDILNKVLEQAKMKGDMNQFDTYTLMTQSIDFRDNIHKIINALRG